MTTAGQDVFFFFYIQLLIGVAATVPILIGHFYLILNVSVLRMHRNSKILQTTKYSVLFFFFKQLNSF